MLIVGRSLGSEPTRYQAQLKHGVHQKGCGRDSSSPTK